MTKIIDLPESAHFVPTTWTVNEASREHILGWKVPYADYLAFRNATLFTTETFTVTGGSIVRVSPLQCPTDPELVALDIRWWQPPQINQRGQVDSGGPWEEILDEAEEPTGIYQPRTSAPPWGLVYPLVRFGIPQYPMSGDQAFLSVSEEDHVESVTLPNHAFELIDESGAHIEWVAQDINVNRGASAFRITYHEVSDLPALQAFIHPYLGKVNNATVTIPLMGAVCPAGTLKVATKSADTSINHGNNRKSTLSLQVAYIDTGWNRAIASVSGHVGIPRRVNPRPFTEANISPIFAPTT